MEELLTPAELGARLKAHAKTVRRLSNEGVIPASLLVGTQRRHLWSEAEADFRDQAANPPERQRRQVAPTPRRRRNTSAGMSSTSDVKALRSGCSADTTRPPPLRRGAVGPVLVGAGAAPSSHSIRATRRTSVDTEITTALAVAKRLESDGDHGAREAEALRSLVRRCEDLERRLYGARDET
jgi:hypothetical protein